MKNRKKKKWSDFLWIAELGYLCLGFFNILFAWLGMLFFCIPLSLAAAKHTATATADEASFSAYWEKS